MNIISVEVPSGIDVTTCLLCRASVKISKFFHHLQNVHDVLFDHEFILKVNLIGRKKIEALMGTSEKTNPNNNHNNGSKRTIKSTHPPASNHSDEDVKPFSFEETIFDLEIDAPLSSEKNKFEGKCVEPKEIYKDDMANEAHSENSFPQFVKMEPDDVSKAININENKVLAHSTTSNDNLFKSEESISRDDSYSNRSLLTCSTCTHGKTYKSKYHLKRHEKSHTRENIANSSPSQSFIKSEESIPRDDSYSTGNLLTCSMCSNGKFFKSRHHLKRHEYQHTGEKPFSCDDCSQSFSRRDHLKRHNKRMH